MAFTGGGQGNRGNISAIIAKFPNWAAGSQHECVQILAGKGIDGDLNALCAWLKDRSTGTTHWRGKHHTASEDGMTQAYWFSEDISQDQRDSWAKRGIALPDGSYPIPDTSHLHKAMQAVGRAGSAAKMALVKAHIRRRATALNATASLTPAFQASADIESGQDLFLSNVQHFIGSDVITEGLLDGIASYTMQFMDMTVHDLGHDGIVGAHASSETDPDNDGDDDTDPAKDTDHDAGMGKKKGKPAKDATKQTYNQPGAADVHVNQPLPGGYIKPQGGTASSSALRPFKELFNQFMAMAKSGNRVEASEKLVQKFWADPRSFCACEASESAFCEDRQFCSGQPDVAGSLHGTGMSEPAEDGPDGNEDEIGSNEQDDPAGAGSKSKATPKPKTAAEYVFEPVRTLPKAYMDVADLIAHKSGETPTSRLFVEITPNAWSKFVESGKRLPYLPKPGIYTHQKYGTVVISKPRNQRFVENMNNHVYQSRIPLDLEHQSKLSGAAAWITRLEMNEDGSADAIVDMVEPMGQKMLAENRFLFISPEWLDEWTQPHTGHKFNDVPIGGALTTRPYFKEQSLRSLVASERGFTVINWPKTNGGSQMGSLQQPTTPAATVASSQPVQMSEDALRQFTALQEQHETLSRQFAEEKQKNEALAKQFADEQAATRVKRFTDEVRGRSDENNVQWFGEIAEHVTMLDDLAKAFGEDSDQVKRYITNQREHARQMSENTALLRKQGVTSMQTSDASAGGGKFAAALKKQREANPTMSSEQVFARVFSEDPTLYEDYLRSNPSQRGEM